MMPNFVIEVRNSVAPIRRRLVEALLIGTAVLPTLCSALNLVDKLPACDGEATNSVWEILNPSLNNATESEAIRKVGEVLRKCPSWTVFGDINQACKMFRNLQTDSADLLELFQVGAPEHWTIYRTDGTWNKFVPDFTQLASSPELEFISGSVLAGRGTYFYLGEVEGQLIFATNYHVLPTQEECAKGKWGFSQILLPNQTAILCKQVVGSWSDVDMTLFVGQSNDPQQVEFLKKHMLRFDFSSQTKGTLLATAGFGDYGMKPYGQCRLHDQCPLPWAPSVDFSPSCVLRADTQEAHPISDPDHLHPGQQIVWSLPDGCGQSSGDSGSPVLRRDSLRVVGLSWTAGTPVPRDLKYADMTQDDIWRYSSFMSPATEIHKRLKEALKRSDISRLSRQVIEFVMRSGEGP